MPTRALGLVWCAAVAACGAPQQRDAVPAPEVSPEPPVEVPAEGSPSRCHTREGPSLAFSWASECSRDFCLEDQGLPALSADGSHVATLAWSSRPSQVLGSTAEVRLEVLPVEGGAVTETVALVTAEDVADLEQTLGYCCESLPPGEVCDAGTITCPPDEEREAAFASSFVARIEPRLAAAERLLASGRFCPLVPVGEEDPIPGDHEDLVLRYEVEHECEADPEGGLPVVRVAVTVRERATGSTRLERSVELFCGEDCDVQPCGVRVGAWTSLGFDVVLLIVDASTEEAIFGYPYDSETRHLILRPELEP